MLRLAIPDLLIEKRNEDSFFESSENLVFARATNDDTELYFKNLGFVSVNSSVKRLNNLFHSKGFMVIDDRLLISINNIREIIYEDYEYYIVMHGCERIMITKQEADHVKESLQRIAS